MATDHRRGELSAQNDVGRVVFLEDEGILPVEWEITGAGRGTRASALYANTAEYREALDRYYDTDNCCRVFYDRCRKLLREMQNAADQRDPRCIQLQPERQQTGGR